MYLLKVIKNSNLITKKVTTLQFLVKFSLGFSKQSLERSDWPAGGGHADCRSVPGWVAGKAIAMCPALRPEGGVHPASHCVCDGPRPAGIV